MKAQIAKILNWKAHRNFELGALQPQVVYAKLENEILQVLRQGQFWQQRGQALDSLANFPITDYETYRSALDQAFVGTRSPLTGETIDFWCKSSGSSAAPKLFPMTKTYRAQLLRITGALSFNVGCKLGWAMNKPLIFFPATGSGQRSPAGIEVGFISRYMFLKLPRFIRNSYAIPAELFESDELLEKWGPLYALATDVSCYLATVPNLIALFCEKIETRKEELLGYLSGEIAWPAGLPKRKVSQRRLQEIRRALSKAPFSMIELWPSLRLLVSWKGSTAGLQIPRVERFSQGQIFFSDAVYSATEGWMTVPTLTETEPGAPLHLGSTFVEFCPEGVPPEPHLLLKPWELEIGKNYEVFLSQGMGFVRYRLLDVVRVNGFYKQSPVLEFLYKAGNMVSLGQTRFSEINILEALKQSQFRHDPEWTIAPAKDGSGLIFHTTEIPNDLLSRVQHLDSCLAQINPEIEDDYVHGLLQRMTVNHLPFAHAFWVAARHGQGKPRILCKTPLES